MLMFVPHYNETGQIMKTIRMRIVKDWRYGGDLRAYPEFHRPTYFPCEFVGFVDVDTALDCRTQKALELARMGKFANIDEEAEASINSALNYDFSRMQ